MTVRLLVGDCREVLATLPEVSVQMCVTSPPYFGLRDYGVDGQIGLEATVEEYVAQLVAVFREVRRVLRDDGVLFLNLGDSYCGGPSGSKGTATEFRHGGSYTGNFMGIKAGDGLKPKDLVGIPWRVAFALQADGWYLRSDIIWAKPNPMPESVRDRPTKAHEYIFLLTKQARYYWDSEAVKEEAQYGYSDMTVRSTGRGWDHDAKESKTVTPGNGGTRNTRSVWTIATAPFAEAHFATFPPALAERCIKAGTSEKGACSACGAPWERATQRVDQGWDGSRYGERAIEATGGAKSGGTARSTLGSSNGKLVGKSETTGWQPTCACSGQWAEEECWPDDFLTRESGMPATRRVWVPGGSAHPEPVPCVVLDPFGGAGTVGLVADRLGRDAVLIELNPAYAEMARRRIAGDAPLFAEVE